jgi:hypothetical protein
MTKRQNDRQVKNNMILISDLRGIIKTLVLRTPTSEVHLGNLKSFSKLYSGFMPSTKAVLVYWLSR